MSVGNYFCWLEKKCRLENFRTFPEMQDRKTAEAEKKPLGPGGRGGKKLSVGEKNVGWRFRVRIPEVPGSNPGGPGGSGFRSRREQYLNRRNKPRFLSANEPKWAQMCPNEPKCAENFFFRSNPSFGGQNRRRPLFRLKSTETSFPVKNQFFRPKLTKTTFPGQI